LRSLTTTMIAGILKVDVSEAQAIRRGQVELSLSQWQVLATATGLASPEHLPSVAIPADLYLESGHPSLRSGIETLGRKQKMARDEVRRWISQEAFALAARQTGSSTNRLRARLSIVLERELRRDSK
jgi:hypothetical protein